MKDIIYLSTIEEIRAFTDPYRLNILRTLHKLGKPSTVKQIADCMGEVPAKVHYHVKKLEKHNILELHHTENIKGIIAKYYQQTAKQFHMSEVNEKDKEIFMNKATEACASILEDHKKSFLKDIQTRVGSISNSEVYVEKEKYDEFIKYVSNFIEENSIKKEGEGIVHRKILLATIGELHKKNIDSENNGGNTEND